MPVASGDTPADPEPDSEPTPDQLWCIALVAAVHAQQEYELLLSNPDADDAELDRVWLRLYRAQETQAELLRAA